jgi:hypothetical protein
MRKADQSVPSVSHDAGEDELSFQIQIAPKGKRAACATLRLYFTRSGSNARELLLKRYEITRDGSGHAFVPAENAIPCWRLTR